MLVQQIHGQTAAPFRIIIAPSHHIAYDFHIGIFGLDGIVELFVTLVIVIALLPRIGLVVLITHLKIFYSEGFWMTVFGTHGSILGTDGTVGILQRIQALVYPWLDTIVRCLSAVPYPHVHHVERFGPQILSQLQILMIPQSVGGTVAPVHIPVAFTLFDRTDGALPAEGIVGTLLPLHETTTRESHKLRMQLPQHVGQIRTHTVLTIAECGWEEAHHIQLHLSYTIEHKRELRLGIIVKSGQRGLVFCPPPLFSSGEYSHLLLSVHLFSVGRAQFCLHGAPIGWRLGPERQAIGASLHGVNPPVALVNQTYRRSW